MGDNMEREPISVLVVDDNDGIRQAYRFYLKTLPSIAKVLDAGTGETGVKMAQESGPDVVLMDVCMPNMNGIQATREIRKLCPSIRVVGWTVSDEVALIRDMIAAGAHGFIMKGDSLEETTDALFKCLDQDCYISPSARDLLLSDNHDRGNRHGSRLQLLSRRQLEVVQLRARGLSPRQVADHLGITEYTVKSHLSSAMTKWSVHSCVDVVRIYLQEAPA